MNRLVGTAIVVGLTASWLNAAALRVPSKFATIQEALDAAQTGDEVVVAPGEYVIRAPLDFNRLPPSRDLILRSESGPAETIVRMAEEPKDRSAAPVFVFEHGESRLSRLEGFTISGGKGWQWLQGPSNNWYTRGGAVQCLGGASPTIADCVVADNLLEGDGGVVFFEGRDSDPGPTLVRCRITANRSSGSIVRFFRGNDGVIEDCTITQNEPGGAGTVWAWQAVLAIRGCVIAQNLTAGFEAQQSQVTVEHSTIAWNTWTPYQVGLWGCSGTISNSIIAGSPGEALGLDPPQSVEIERSCVLGAQVRPGSGNLNLDPSFCGWGPVGEVWVDATSPTGGDGSAASPYRELSQAIQLSLALAHDSPCRGSGTDGVDMGAAAGRCDATPAPDRTVHATAGTHEIRALDFQHPVILEGAGAGETVLKGRVAGLPTGARLSGVTLLGWIEIYSGQKPEIADCTIAGDQDAGVVCANASPTLTRCEISRNGGDGLVVWGPAAPVLVDCVIAENSNNGVVAGNPDAKPSLTNCTVAANLGWGIWSQGQAMVTLKNSIVWENFAGSLSTVDGGSVNATYSDIETAGAAASPGAGNIRANPLFCGFAGPEESHVDATAIEPGDGSAAAPYPSLEAALHYGVALGTGSPCIGKGQGGVNMGATTGECVGPSLPAVVLRLAAGSYENKPWHFAHPISIEGAGADETKLAGWVNGLRTGRAVNAVTLSGGISVQYGQKPEISDCVLPWLGCNGSSPTVTRCTLQSGGINGTSAPRFLDCLIAGSTGWGIVANDPGAKPVFENCTIASHFAGGVLTQNQAQATLTSCIVWGNAQNAVSPNDGKIFATYSDIETSDGSNYAGTGNIRTDPLFCGFEGPSDVYVDASAAVPGDGSAGNPWPSLDQAVRSSQALTDGSPCRGAGKGGADMGAELGACDGASSATRTVHLAAGTYSSNVFHLLGAVSLVGAGREKTIIESPVGGVRSGVTLRDLTITSAVGGSGGLQIAAGASPVIERCAVAEVFSNTFNGVVFCSAGSSPVFRNCEIRENGQPQNQFPQWFPIVYCEAAKPQFLGCRFLGNHGTALIGQGGDLTVKDSVFSGNRGGAIIVRDSAGTFQSCQILGNSSSGNGGGISCEGSGTTAVFRDCLVAENVATGSGGGLFCANGSAPILDHVTLVGNRAGFTGSGIYCGGASPIVRSSIVWSNAGRSIHAEADSAPDVAFSTIEGEPLWEGEGNSNEDPLFCGFAGPEEVFVDASFPGPGNGTPADPFREIASALDYSLALSSASPTRGAGLEGTDQGAPAETCAQPGPRRRTIHLAKGWYAAGVRSLNYGVSIEGAGAGTTIVEGTLVGLRGGHRLTALTITNGGAGGVLVAEGESPELVDLVVERNFGPGIHCAGGASPSISRCSIFENGYYGIEISQDAAPVIADCKLWANRGPPFRHGQLNGVNIFCGFRSRPTVTRCAMSDAFSSGLVASQESQVTLRESTIRGHGIAGIQGSQATLDVSNCEISGNRGIGIALFGVGKTTLRNCLVAGNGTSGWWNGPGVAMTANDGQTLRIENCTVVGNPLQEGQGTINLGCNTSATIVNSIIWGPEERPGVVVNQCQPPAALSVSWCIVRGEIAGEWEGDGYFVEDPLFVQEGAWNDGGTPDDPSNDTWTDGDYRLQQGSPAIDSGASDETNSNTDLAGKGRVCGSQVDFGAYEFQYEGCPILPQFAAQFTVSARQGTAPLEVAVDGAASQAAGLTLTFAWDFGDGTTATELTARHVYERPGRFWLTLRVSDQHARTATSRAVVTVALPRTPPVAPWSTVDIAGPFEFPGGTRLTGDCLVLSAGGWPLGRDSGGPDRIHLASRELQGDTTITAAIGVDRLLKRGGQAGVMVRVELDPAARCFGAAIQDVEGGPFLVAFTRPSAAGNLTFSTPVKIERGDALVRIERQGSALNASYSTDGSTYKSLRRLSFSGWPQAYLCCAFTAGNDPGGDAPFEPILARVCVEIAGGGLPAAAQFRRGDIDGNGDLEITDAIATLGHLFLGEPKALSCDAAADADDSGSLELTDGIYILEHLFLTGAAPRAPYPVCGTDPTPDPTTCVRSAACP